MKNYILGLLASSRAFSLGQLFDPEDPLDPLARLDHRFEDGKPEAFKPIPIQKFTLECATDLEDPVPPELQDTPPMQIYDRLSNFDTMLDGCEKLSDVLPLEVSLPGEVHQHLEQYVGHLFDRFNHINLRYIPMQTWNYTAFVKPEVDVPNALLRLDSVGTIASIFFDGEQVCSTDNLYRLVECPLNRTLAAGEEHVLSVVIESTVKHSYLRKAQNYMDDVTHEYFWTNMWISESWIQEVRTQGTDFGWDWSLAAAPQGVFGPITLDSASAPFELLNPIVEQNFFANGSLEVNVSASFKVLKKQEESFSLKARLSFQNEQVAETEVRTFNYSDPSTSEILTLPIGPMLVETPHLWYPHSAGEQPLYKLEVLSVNESQASESIEVYIGLRKVELIQEPMNCSYPSETCSEPGEGRSFFFKINDQEIYLKGANMVPIDYFPDRMHDKEFINWLLHSALQANYNILRIWGGGMYLTNYFYEEADRLGLLIWQDTMFSCKFYPFKDPRFVTNSALEVKEQVTRLQHHASIFHWVLNNEGVDMIYWDPENTKNKTAFMEQYNSFYIDTLIPILKETGVQDHFIDTSPSNGISSYAPYTKYAPDFPTSDPNFGDGHYYYLMLDCEDDATHKQFRMLSESGFQSEASIADIADFSNPKTDWFQDSRFERLRATFNQPHDVLRQQVARHYEIPEDTPENFPRFVWLSQIQQGRCMQTVFGKQRQGRSTVKNMGSIYWQFNTDWPAPSWATLDFRGSWKASHSMVQRLFADLLVHAAFVTQEDGDKTLEVWIVNDRQEAFGDLMLTRYSYNQTDAEGKEIQSLKNFTVKAADSQLAMNLTKDELFGDAAAEDRFFIAELTIGDQVHREFIYGTYLVNSSISEVEAKPNLTVEATSDIEFTNFDGYLYATQNFTVTNEKGSVPAHFVTFEATTDSPGYFSENVFGLLPGESRSVQWVFSGPIEALAVSVRSY